MSIALLSLPVWTKNAITALYQTTSSTDFNNALNRFLSEDAVIVVNGLRIDRAKFAQELQSEKFDEAGAVVTFVDIVSKQDSQPGTGSVGAFYNVIVAEEIRVRDAPVENKITASINVVVKEDSRIVIPPHGIADRRRVALLNLVTTESPVPFNIKP